MNPERWSTDDELRAARRRFSEQIPGFVQPVAYTVARLDGGAVTFAHVNDINGVHFLPGVVLASVCGYVATTATFELSRGQLATAVQLLSPAEASTHWDHPNLWSWRKLLEESSPDSRFVAVFVRDLDDPPVDPADELFRKMLTGTAP